jgi:hypothetical protein
LSLDISVSNIIIIEYAGSSDNIFEDGECLFFLEWSTSANECF